MLLTDSIWMRAWPTVLTLIKSSSERNRIKNGTYRQMERQIAALLYALIPQSGGIINHLKSYFSNS